MDVEKVMLLNPPTASQVSQQTLTAKDNKTEKKLDKAVEIDYNGSAASDKTTGRLDKKAENQNYEYASDEDLISKVIDDANKLLKGTKRNMEYSVHEATHQIMVKVVNSDTGEVIREIPPEKALDIMAKIWELAGLFVDEKS